jgi:hypothetical protein
MPIFFNDLHVFPTPGRGPGTSLVPVAYLGRLIRKAAAVHIATHKPTETASSIGAA